jgi:CDGSH-type Zn-finger protein
VPGPTIRTEANGPYVVTGPITLDSDGCEHSFADGHIVKLRRCGHSANKPFCDSTHQRVDFVSRPSFEPEPTGP